MKNKNVDKGDRELSRRGFIGVIAGFLAVLGIGGKQKQANKPKSNVSDKEARHYTRGDDLAG